jgi:hypothetical protein
VSTLNPCCPDCGAPVAHPHTEGCAVARCLYTGGRRLSCGSRHRADLELDHACGGDAWTGRWPGEAEAAEFGWWACWDGPGPEQGWDYQGQGWIQVPAGTPGAVPDLDRLSTDAQWDRDALRWVRRVNS